MIGSGNPLGKTVVLASFFANQFFFCCLALSSCMINHLMDSRLKDALLNPPSAPPIKHLFQALVH